VAGARSGPVLPPVVAARLAAGGAAVPGCANAV